VSLLSGIALIIAYTIIVELVAVRMNRSIVRNSNLNADTYLFNVRNTSFSIFVSIILFSSLAAFAYFFIIDFGLADSRSITSIILFLIGSVDLARKPLLKIEVNDNLIHLKSITRRAHFTFDEIRKVEITQFFGNVHADIFSNDDLMFTLKDEMSGYYQFIERLKKENVEWSSILGKPLDKSDI